MPHCIVEYAKILEQKVSVSELIQRVHQGAVNSQLFQEQDIKTRALAFEHFQTGTSSKAFVHVSMKILSGRSQEQKKQATLSVLKELQKLPFESISLTVELRDMDRETYSKSVL